MPTADGPGTRAGAQQHPGGGGSSTQRLQKAAALYRRGEAARASGRLDEAVDCYARALLLDANHRPSLLSLGAALAALGRDEEAQRALQQAEKGMGKEAAAEEGVAAFVAGGPPPTAIAGAMQALIVPAPAAESSGTELYKRAMLVGGICFPAVLATYIVVGLSTHFAPGLGAAALAALLLASLGSAFFSADRRLAFKGILHGMLWGVGLVLLAGLASIIIAVGRAIAA